MNLRTKKPAGLPARPLPKTRYHGTQFDLLWDAQDKRTGDVWTPFDPNDHYALLREKLAPYGITFYFAGDGHFGNVYYVQKDGKNEGVCKITGDFTEAATAQTAMSIKSPVVPRIRRVLQINLPKKKPAWAIFREDLAPLPNAIALGIDKTYLHHPDFFQRVEKRYVYTSEYRSIKNFLRELLRLRQHGIAFVDLHQANLRIRPSTGEIVISDLGMSFGPKAKIPVLKNPR